jgi:hypothetical protein
MTVGGETGPGGRKMLDGTGAGNPGEARSRLDDQVTDPDHSGAGPCPG